MTHGFQICQKLVTQRHEGDEMLLGSNNGHVVNVTDMKKLCQNNEIFNENNIFKLY